MSVLLSLSLIAVMLASLLFFQAYRVKKNAIRLPEATGDRTNLNAGSINLLHIGESTVAGVGVDCFQRGLTANVVAALQKQCLIRCNWQALAANGATIEQALTFSEPIIKPDILLMTFGVNDTTKFTSARQWQANIKQCVAKFAHHQTQVFFTAVPKMAQFPLLPRPLNWLLGIKAGSLHRQLAAICRQQNWHLIDTNIAIEKHLMAVDGYHPNAQGYTVWGAAIAEAMAYRLPVVSHVNDKDKN